MEKIIRPLSVFFDWKYDSSVVDFGPIVILSLLLYLYIYILLHHVRLCGPSVTTIQ